MVNEYEMSNGNLTMNTLQCIVGQNLDQAKNSEFHSALSRIIRNKPKMAYSCDLMKMARQQCGIMD